MQGRLNLDKLEKKRQCFFSAMLRKFPNCQNERQWGGARMLLEKRSKQNWGGFNLVLWKRGCGADILKVCLFYFLTL